MITRKMAAVAAIFFTLGLISGWLSAPFITGFSSDKEEALLKQVAAQEAKISDQRNTIVAYQRALIGEERDLLSLYDSVQEAGQIDIVVHGDTESGLPVKFIFNCGDAK